MSQGNPRFWNYFNLKDCSKSVSISLDSVTPLPPSALLTDEPPALGFAVPAPEADDDQSRYAISRYYEPYSREQTAMSIHVKNKHRHRMYQLHTLAKRQLLGVGAARELLSQPRFRQLSVLGITVETVHPCLYGEPSAEEIADALEQLLPLFSETLRGLIVRMPLDQGHLQQIKRLAPHLQSLSCYISGEEQSSINSWLSELPSGLHELVLEEDGEIVLESQEVYSQLMICFPRMKIVSVEMGMPPVYLRSGEHTPSSSSTHTPRCRTYQRSCQPTPACLSLVSVWGRNWRAHSLYLSLRLGSLSDSSL
eukprot:TRINITY_DN5040_c1_g1_i2.p1 TRINITY_DN5040_c1_g1~~TRINITY_DN5040_c1_g1_i2.p1  ORF type:complete len:309 (+),score=29.55 TRINITY_DN5040_c1_g1_i2:390-1316(+)